MSTDADPKILYSLCVYEVQNYVFYRDSVVWYSWVFAVHRAGTTASYFHPFSPIFAHFHPLPPITTHYLSLPPNCHPITSTHFFRIFLPFSTSCFFLPLGLRAPASNSYGATAVNLMTLPPIRAFSLYIRFVGRRFSKCFFFLYATRLFEKTHRV